MSDVEKLLFWRKVTIYTVFTGFLGLVLAALLGEYAFELRFEYLIFAIIVIVVYSLSHIMK